jgi:predicted nucleic-acid-binding Zn-ribbon protein
MKEYYFRYVVTGEAKEFTTLKEARKEANKEGEKIYLTIYSKLNSYAEPYDEEEVNKATNIMDARLRLIKSFNKLTNN